MNATGGLRPRRLAEVVPQRMREEPVVIITGPRTVGKSTLLAALAAELGEACKVTTIHVRYEILDDPGRSHPDSAADSFAWGVQAVGLPADLSAHGVGDTLDEALADLGEGVRALFAAITGD